MENLITYGIGGLITVFFVWIYLRSQKKKEARAQAAVEKGKKALRAGRVVDHATVVAAFERLVVPKS